MTMDMTNKRMQSAVDVDSEDGGAYNMGGSQAQLWKESINIDNIASEFLGTNVTGEVMNLDDFLRELQESRGPKSVAAGVPPRNGHMIEDPDEVGANEVIGVRGIPEPTILQPRTNRGGLPEYHTLQPPNIAMPPNNVGLSPNNVVYREEEMSPLQSPPVNQVRPLVQYDAPPQQKGNEDKKPYKKRMSRKSVGSDRNSSSRNNSGDTNHSLNSELLSEANDTRSIDGDDEYEVNGTGKVDVAFSRDDLRLATIPGQHFDPATRRFSDEELKPQPIIRKRKKQFIPSEMKNSKYWEKRLKNNEAAKRSREARRLKENQIAMRARYLEQENSVLRREISTLKVENDELKQMMSTLEARIKSMDMGRQ